SGHLPPPTQMNNVHEVLAAISRSGELMLLIIARIDPTAVKLVNANVAHIIRVSLAVARHSVVNQFMVPEAIIGYVVL
ncbi:hypothetical protein J6590_101116, partial [Homalodisca vitripennis]